MDKIIHNHFDLQECQDEIVKNFQSKEEKRWYLGIVRILDKIIIIKTTTQNSKNPTRVRLIKISDSAWNIILWL